MINNQKVTINELVFKSLYYRYKAFITPMGVIFVCFLLFYFVVLNQIQGFLAQRDALTVDEQKVATMKQNVTLLNSLNSDTISNMLTIATTALPAEKDFAGIVGALQNASALSGAVLGDYSFQLGDLSGKDISGKINQTPVQLNVSLKGDATSAQRFATELKKQLPLADTTAVAVSGNSSITVTVLFYYAALPKIVFDSGVNLPVLSNEDKKLLNNLAVRANLSLTPIATSSPALTPVPTKLPSPTPSPIASQSAQ